MVRSRGLRLTRKLAFSHGIVGALVSNASRTHEYLWGYRFERSHQITVATYKYDFGELDYQNSASLLQCPFLSLPPVVFFLSFILSSKQEKQTIYLGNFQSCKITKPYKSSDELGTMTKDSAQKGKLVP